MAQVLLLNPTYHGRTSDFSMPSGLLCVAAILQAKGHKVQIFDAHVHQYTPSQSLQAIAAMSFDILGIGGISTSYYFWKEFVALFRQKYGSSIPIMAGGTVAATMPDTFLKFIDADAICTGDAEPVVSAMVENLINRQPLAALNGIGYRDGKGFVIKPGLRVKNMDLEVPIPPYDLINIEDYRTTLRRDSTNWDFIKHYVSGKNYLEFMLFSSRGCPYDCFFCSRNFGRQFVQHSVSKFIEHLIFVAEKYSPNLFCIEDELMTTRRDWVINFCAKYKASGLDIPFRMNARVDSIDRELLTLLKESHCYEVDLGIESGSPLILKEMNKGVTVAQNLMAFKMCHEVGIYPSPTMVFGMPSETSETMAETKAFLIEADVQTFGSFYATAYPGSALFQHALSKGLIKNADEYMLTVDNASKFGINYTSLSDRRLQREAFKVATGVLYAWYKRRGKWWDILKLKLRIAMVYLKAGSRILFKQGPSNLVSKVFEEIKSYKK